jgi:hypothetical protein
MCGSKGTVKSKAAANSAKISNRDQKYIFNKKVLKSLMPQGFMKKKNTSSRTRMVRI